MPLLHDPESPRRKAGCTHLSRWLKGSLRRPPPPTLAAMSASPVLTPSPSSAQVVVIVLAVVANAVGYVSRHFGQPLRARDSLLYPLTPGPIDIDLLVMCRWVRSPWCLVRAVWGLNNIRTSMYVCALAKKGWSMLPSPLLTEWTTLERLE